MDNKYGSKSCRLCLESNCCLINIFVKREEDELLLADTISDLFNVEVSRQDIYPNVICTECHSKILHFYRIRFRVCLNELPTFVLFKNQSRIVSSTFDYAKKYNISTPDNQHSPLSVNHTPVSLDFDGMVAEEDYNTRKVIVENLLESVACILRDIRVKPDVTEDVVAFGIEETKDPLALSNDGSRDVFECPRQTPEELESFREPLVYRDSSPESSFPQDDYRSPNKILSSDDSSSSSENSVGRLVIKEEVATDAQLNADPLGDTKCLTSNVDVKLDGQDAILYSSGSQGDDCMRCDKCRREYKRKRFLSIHVQSHFKGSKVAPQRGRSRVKREGKDWTDERRKNWCVWEQMSMCVEGEDGGWLRCRSCGGRFTGLEDLKQHVKVRKEGRAKTKTSTKKRTPGFACCVCGQLCTSSTDVLRHAITRHMESRPFKCHICGLTFKLEKYVKKHMKLHTQPKTVKCDECGKKFTDNTSLRLHSAVHTKESKFKCADCGKKFRAKHLLMVHLRTHDESKRIQCPECPSSFTQRSDLNKHMAKHTGVRDFKCSECGREFLYKKNLISHRKLHTKITVALYNR